MLEGLRAQLALDLDQVDLRRGVRGLVALALALIAIAGFGTVGLTACLAALFVTAADAPGAPRERVESVVAMTGGGAVLAALAVWIGTDDAALATLLTFVVTGLATLAAGFGRAWAVRGLLLALWAVIALSLLGDQESATEVAGAYVLGGILVAVVLVAATLRSAPGGDTRTATPARRSLEEIVRSPLGAFALLRAAAVGLATAVGIELFPEHPFWMALTVLLVLRPKAGEAVAAGVLRTIGTLLGALLATGVVALAQGSDALVVVAFLIAAFGAVALKDVNYAVFVFFLTAAIVLIQDVLQKDADLAAEERFLATVLGAVVAFLALAVGRLMSRGDAASDAPT